MVVPAPPHGPSSWGPHLHPHPRAFALSYFEIKKKPTGRGFAGGDCAELHGTAAVNSAGDYRPPVNRWAAGRLTGFLESGRDYPPGASSSSNGSGRSGGGSNALDQLAGGC